MPRPPTTLSPRRSDAVLAAILAAILIPAAMPVAAQNPADRSAAAAPENRSQGKIVPLGGALVSASRAELAWTAEPGSAHRPYRVEIMGRISDTTFATQLFAAETPRSTMTAELENTAPQMIWRVLRTDPSTGDYAASPWQMLGAGDDAAAPRGVLQIRCLSTDIAAHRLARELADDFARAGYWTQLSFDDKGSTDVTTVTYTYPSDADLARQVAGFLPVVTAEDVAYQPDETAFAGSVVLHLVGGPSD